MPAPADTSITYFYIYLATMLRPPPLNAIRVFVTAASLGSFQSAAKALFVTPGAVSRQIQALEAHLGTQLFRRSPREVVLTQVGEALLSQVGQALIEIEQTCRQVYEAAREIVLRVETTSAFSMYWLIPRLREFRDGHPDIHVELSTMQGATDRSRPADVFIRRNPEQFGRLKANKLASERSVLVCSRDYALDNDMSCAASIARCCLIMARSGRQLWTKWLAQHDLKDGPDIRRMEFDSTILAVQAAAQGLGVAFISTLFLDSASRNGALVRVPGLEPMGTDAYYWLCRESEPAWFVETFVRWLEQSMAEHAVREPDFGDTAQSSAESESLCRGSFIAAKRRSTRDLPRGQSLSDEA